MNLLLLPGNSKRNKAWLEMVEQSVSPMFANTRTHDYDHWDTEGSTMDLEHEVERLSGEIKDFAPYGIFAKSAGSILACKAIYDGVLKPEACIFTGFPMVMIKNLDLPVDKWLLSSEFPITVIQNQNDPLGSFANVKNYFTDLDRSNVSIVSAPEDTHDYEDFELLRDTMRKLLHSL